MSMALDHGVRALQVKQWREWVGCGKVRQWVTFSRPLFDFFSYSSAADQWIVICLSNPFPPSQMLHLVPL